MTTQDLASRTMRGRSTEHLLRRRDAAGGEMEMLARVMQDPSPNPKEVAGYVADLMKKEHIPSDDAARLLATMPPGGEALRNWARAAFASVMHQGIHTHAAFPRELYPSPTATPDQSQPAPQQPETMQ